MSEFGDFREPYEQEPQARQRAGELFEGIIRTQLERHMGAVAVTGEGPFATETLQLKGESPWGDLAFTVASGIRGPRVSVAKGEDNEPICDYTTALREGHVLRNDRSSDGEALATTEILNNPAAAEEIAADYIAARRQGARLGFNSQPVGTHEISSLGYLLGNAEPTA